MPQARENASIAHESGAIRIISAPARIVEPELRSDRIAKVAERHHSQDAKDRDLAQGLSCAEAT
jgi:hypothetical protein